MMAGNVVHVLVLLSITCKATNVNFHRIIYKMCKPASFIFTCSYLGACCSVVSIVGVVLMCFHFPFFGIDWTVGFPV